jgi:hypothetical protein
MANELKRLVKEIQYREDKTLKAIAESIGYSTAYFTDQINKGSNQEIKERLQRLVNEPNKIEQNVPRETTKHSMKDSKEPSENPIGAKAATYSDRYIKLLEETVKEKKDQLKELQARLDELAGRQADFLAKVEGSIARYEHLVHTQLQNAQQESDSSPVAVGQTYKSEGSGRKKNT